MDIAGVEKYVCARLTRELSGAFEYHSLRHTLDVRAAVAAIGEGEGVAGPELACLAAAALFHDLGYVAGCVPGHEERAAELALRRLGDWGFDLSARELVAELILATRLPCRPRTTLEAVLCDADIEYLGRPENIELSEAFRRELANLGYGFGELEWLAFELKFINQVQFFTASCRAMRQEGLELLRAQFSARFRSLGGKEF